MARNYAVLVVPHLGPGALGRAFVEIAVGYDFAVLFDRCANLTALGTGAIRTFLCIQARGRAGQTRGIATLGTMGHPAPVWIGIAIGTANRVHCLAFTRGTHGKLARAVVEEMFRSGGVIQTFAKFNGHGLAECTDVFVGLGGTDTHDVAAISIRVIAGTGAANRTGMTFLCFAFAFIARGVLVNIGGIIVPVTIFNVTGATGTTVVTLYTGALSAQGAGAVGIGCFFIQAADLVFVV